MAKKKTTKRSKLPDHPADLIDVALKDLAWVEKQPKKYKVYMGDWHSPNSHCKVCLAGSVMAGTLHANPRKELHPSDFHGEEGKLRALNLFRCGDLGAGIYRMGLEVDPNGDAILRARMVQVPQYSKRSKKFHIRMREIANALRGITFRTMFDAKPKPIKPLACL